MGLYLRIAFRNLLRARRRSLLLGAGLFIVSLFLILMLALSQGITETMISSSTALYTGHVNVGGWFKPKHAEAWPLVQEGKKLRRIVEANTPGLDHIVDRGRGWARLVSPNSSLYAGITGIDVANEEAFLKSLQLAEEREYKEGGRAEVLGSAAALAEPNSIMLFAGQAKRLKVGVGDIITMSAELSGGTANTMDVRVAVIAKDMGFMSNWAAYVSNPTLRVMYDYGEDIIGALQIYLKDPDQAPAVMEHLRGVLAENGYTVMDHQPEAFYMKFERVGGEDWKGQRLDLTTWDDEIGMMMWAIRALDSISLFLVAIMTMIIVVGIINTMHISVRERTSEIGTMRALGMRRGQVKKLILIESAILGALATGAGATFGALVAALLNRADIRVSVDALRAILMSDTLALTVRPSQVLIIVASFTVIAAVAALWPAVRAARLQPVTAIHRAE